MKLRYYVFGNVIGAIIMLYCKMGIDSVFLTLIGVLLVEVGIDWVKEKKEKEE